MQIESAAAVISSLPAPISPPRNFLASFRSLQLKPIVTTRAAIPAALSKPPTRKTLSHLTNLERVLRPSPPAPLINNTNDISPHNTLSHLLQTDPSYSSPRSSIASHWRELHGANDWENLLDPLNPNLRRELLHYGDLVQSAYHAFFQLSPNFSPPILPNSYRLARHLFTTSSINTPTWFPSVSRTNCIGFVAVCNDEFEIHRMGRRDIVVALRGTSTYLEWMENLRINLVAHLDGKCTHPTWAACNIPKVECGFRALYKTLGPNRQSLSTAVVNEVRRLVEFYKGEELSISIAGHSLGAALAILVADELSFLNGPPIAVYSFGGPRVGNRAFGYRLEKINRVKVLRMVNVHDLVTKVPIGFEGIGIDGYEHVGRELRLDSQVSPFLRPNADPSCCHDLEAYLHLIDGLGGLSGCQFRPNAKRSLLRLLCQQRENVRQIYIHEAQALGLDPIGLSSMNCLSC